MDSTSVPRRPAGRSAAIKRLVRLAAAMVADPAGSLPRQTRSWGELKGAYRLLSNRRVCRQAMQQPHRDQTWAACVESGRRRGHEKPAVVLAVQDDTELDFSRAEGEALSAPGGAGQRVGHGAAGPGFGTRAGDVSTYDAGG